MQTTTFVPRPPSGPSRIAHAAARLTLRPLEHLIPDNELGLDPDSGVELATNADILFHDAQYTDAEYGDRAGWGHSSLAHALAFARLADVKRLVTFHHDPSHDDAAIDRLTAEAVAIARPPFPVTAGGEGAVFELA